MRVEGFFEWLGQALGTVIRFIVEGLADFFGLFARAGHNFLEGLSRTLGMDRSLLSPGRSGHRPTVAGRGRSLILPRLDHRRTGLAVPRLVAAELADSLIAPIHRPVCPGTAVFPLSHWPRIVPGRPEARNVPHACRPAPRAHASEGVALAAPMILSNLSVPLVALVDSSVIGHLPHAHQLGAVAVGGSLYTLLVWVMGFLRMGTTGFAAQAAGRQDGGALRQILLQGLLLAVGFALLLGTLGVPLKGAALQLMQPSAELNDLTRDYFHTRLFGLPAALASYALIGWFPARRTPARRWPFC